MAFLNMWLERFIFYGSSCGPTYNHKLVVEHLVVGKAIVDITSAQDVINNVFD